MARCDSCKKVFDYEKYYGICPKCGAFNQKTRQEQTGWSGSAKRNERYWSDPGTQKRTVSRKKDSASLVIFVCLLIGILGRIVLPFLDSFESKVVKPETDGVEGTWDYETEEPVTQNKKPQSAEITEKKAGEAFVLGDQTKCSVVVREAYILRKADTVPEFPKGQNLIAVKADYETSSAEDYQYHPYLFSGTPYVEYQGTFRECTSKFDMEAFAKEEFKEELLDLWSMKENTAGTGIFLAFVPEGVTSIQFCMDSRIEENNDVLAVYAVPLEISAGEDEK